MRRNHSSMSTWGSCFVVGVVMLGCSSGVRRVHDVSPGCSDLPDDSALASLYTEPIQGVTPTFRHGPGGDEQVLAGARIHLRRRQVDDDALAKALSCHATRSADVIAIVRALPHQAHDPLRPHGQAQVAVNTEGDVTTISVTSRDPAVAAEILERAKTLAARSLSKSSRRNPSSANDGRTTSASSITERPW